MTQNAHLRGIALALAGFFLWVVCDTTVKLAGDYGLPSQEIAVFLGGFCVLFLVIFLFARGELHKLKPVQPFPILLRAVLNVGIMFCNLAAFPRLSLSGFYVTVFTAPLLIALTSAVFLGERLSMMTALAIFVGFVGVVIALDPVALLASHGSLIGYLAAFAGTFLFVASQLMLRRMANKETPECIILAVFTLITLTGAALSLNAPHFIAPSSHALGILALSALADVLGAFCIAWAMQIGPTATVSSFHYSQLISGSLFGYLIWHDTPTWNLVAGAGIIIASGLYIAHHARLPEANAPEAA